MPTKLDELLALFRSADGLASPAARALLRGLCPELTVGGSGDAPTRVADDSAEGPWLAKEGFVILPEAAAADLCARLLDGIERLTAAGLPATFVYLFDETWRLGLQVGARVSAMIGARYEVVEDVWAWRIAPGTGRGWPPHRGLAAPLLDRDTPQLINTWVALSEAEADRACMHFVPLDDDPSYPGALAGLEAPLQTVRAAPLRAGDALAWNANILHWGGPCAPRARGPRVSCSFSLVRSDALAELAFPAASGAVGDLGARLDAVARQIVTYGRGQSDVSAAVLAWADAAAVMKATIIKLSAQLPPGAGGRKAP